MVTLVTNRTDRLAPGARLTCHRVSEPGPSRPPGARVLEVCSSRPFQGRYLVRFEGVRTREAAEELRGCLLLAPAVEDPDALYVHDLVGREVVELNGTRRGVVVALQANPASDLLVTEDGDLVPLRFVVGRAEGRLIVDVPAGLFE